MLEPSKNSHIEESHSLRTPESEFLPILRVWGEIGPNFPRCPKPQNFLGMRTSGPPQDRLRTKLYSSGESLLVRSFLILPMEPNPTQSWKLKAQKVERHFGQAW